MKSLIHHEYVSIGSQSAKYRIILLHGWGADFDDLIPVGQAITENLKQEFQIISIRAPNLCVNNSGRQWYKLFPADWDEAKKEVKKLCESLTELGDLDISFKKTILFGFSQGAAMALDAGLQLDLGLIIACSGYPHPDWIPKKNCQVLLNHGKLDNVVPLSASKEICNILNENSNKNSQLHEFDGGHEINTNFIKIASQKINEIF